MELPGTVEISLPGLPVFQRALLRQHLYHHQLLVIRQCDDRASFMRAAHNDFAGMNVMRSESVKERMGKGKVLELWNSHGCCASMPPRQRPWVSVVR